MRLRRKAFGSQTHSGKVNRRCRCGVRYSLVCGVFRGVTILTGVGIGTMRRDGTKFRRSRIQSLRCYWARHAGLVNYLLNQRHRQSEDDYSCARVFRSACDWLEDNHTAGPFFLWIDSFDPHEPWDPPKRYADEYMPEYTGKDFITPGAANEGDGATEMELKRIQALYCGEVTFVDKWVGALLNRIDALNLRDDTLVVVMSDHGTQLRDQGRFGKGSSELHPFNTQLNLFIRHPKRTTGP